MAILDIQQSVNVQLQQYTDEKTLVHMEENDFSDTECVVNQQYNTNISNSVDVQLSTLGNDREQEFRMQTSVDDDNMNESLLPTVNTTTLNDIPPQQQTEHEQQLILRTNSIMDTDSNINNQMYGGKSFHHSQVSNADLLIKQQQTRHHFHEHREDEVCACEQFTSNFNRVRSQFVQLEGIIVIIVIIIIIIIIIIIMLHRSITIYYFLPCVCLCLYVCIWFVC